MRLLLFIMLAISVKAYAQDYRQAFDLDRPVPAGLSTRPYFLPSKGYDPLIEKMSQQLAQQMEQKYQELLGGLLLQPESCKAPEINLKKVRALRVSGDFSGCAALAKTCASETDRFSQLSLLEGATCSAQVFRTKEAYDLFDLATSPRFVSSDFQDIAVYRFALFARNTQYDHQVADILARHKAWTESELANIKAVIQMLNIGHAEGFSDQQIQQKIMALIGKHSEWANELVIGWFAHLVLNRYDSLAGLKFLDTTFQNVYEVDRIYKYIFRAIFSTHGRNYKLVKPSLDVYYKYATPYSWLPVEQNLYVQSEQYNQVCKTTLSQGSVARSLKQIKKSWLAGAQPQNILSEVSALEAAHPGKADILTLKASVLNTLGQDMQAFDHYWKAHQVCPHYHRGHWGISGVKREWFYRSLDDYNQIREKVKKEVAEMFIPASLSKYVMNWSMLTSHQADGIKHAIKIWMPYMDGLVAAGTNLYIKNDFEFHNEIPGYASDYDQRVPAPDNRVADEIRGRGGNPVVTDLGETLRTPHGDYNLAAHEIAHSWHLDFLPHAGRRDLKSCITRLYEAAGQRDKYADPYAASHENEYFAQAISYYLIPKGSPARFGLNAEWIENNDPDMFRFIKNIENANGDIKKVSCPI